MHPLWTIPPRPAPSAFYCSLHLVPSGKGADGSLCHVELQMENPNCRSLRSPLRPGPVALAGGGEAAPSSQPSWSTGTGAQNSSPARLLLPGREQALPFPTPSPTIRAVPLFVDSYRLTLTLRPSSYVYGHIPPEKCPGLCQDMPTLAG